VTVPQVQADTEAWNLVEQTGFMFQFNYFFVAETLVSKNIWRRGGIPLAVNLQLGGDANSVSE
jgi:hypothetical protein